MREGVRVAEAHARAMCCVRTGNTNTGTKRPPPAPPLNKMGRLRRAPLPQRPITMFHERPRVAPPNTAFGNCEDLSK